jgi:NAD(P)-dependent dehydrogenase (short-subunit alcohol dehydrogenase family)
VKIDVAVKTLLAAGSVAVGYSCDITDESGLKAVAAEVRQRFGSVDLLILNAGIVTCRLFRDFTGGAELLRDVQVDLCGTMLCAHVFLPLLVNGSRIIMISSGFGLMGAAGYTAYAAAKAGIINFAEALRRELLHQSISVHVACPGYMDTPQLHEELRSMPECLRDCSLRKSIMPPDRAAEKILKKCRKGKFLVIIDVGIFALILLTKLTPRWLRDFFLDRMFPRPP